MKCQMRLNKNLFFLPLGPMLQSKKIKTLFFLKLYASLFPLNLQNLKFRPNQIVNL